MKAKDITPTAEINIDVKNATSAELVKFYNDNSGSSNPIKKFKDRATAESRVTELIEASNELFKGSSKPSVAKKAAKAEKKSKAKAEGKEETRGRKFAGEGKKIFKVGEFKKTNPRREGTHGHTSWEAIKDGMTYEDYIEAGGRNRDLRHDVLAGRLELK